VVRSEALIEIRALLPSVMKQRAEDVLKARHPSLTDAGERAMHRSSSAAQMEQMKLFQPTQVQPHWNQLPLEIRQPTLRLLARVLREHLAAERERGKFSESDHK
jgi:hypothetical protein